MILLGLQSALAPEAWLTTYYYLFGSMFIGALLWKAVIGLLALALSAWVKWRILTTSAMLGVFFALAGFGEALNQVLRTNWGRLLNIGYVINVVWFSLFRIKALPGVRNAIFEVPSWSAWVALAVLALLCLLMLNLKLKAREVVR